eukprot:gene15953-biopygen10565
MLVRSVMLVVLVVRVCYNRGGNRASGIGQFSDLGDVGDVDDLPLLFADAEHRLQSRLPGTQGIAGRRRPRREDAGEQQRWATWATLSPIQSALQQQV